MVPQVIDDKVKKNMRRTIKEFTGGWSKSTEEAYMRAALELVEHGYTPDAALVLLKRLYSAAANDYGE